MIKVGLGGVLEVCGECYKMIVLLFLFCLPLLSILFLKTKRNDLARPVMGTIFLVFLTSRIIPYQPSQFGVSLSTTTVACLYNRP